MEALAIDTLLLRSVLGTEMKITPGRGLMAHVVRADGSGRGAISVAGAMLEAELPTHLRAGEDVRLVVRRVTAERVELTLSEQASGPVPVPIAPASVPLPGGGLVRVIDQEEQRQSGSRAGAGGRQVLALRYDTSALGAIDLRFELDESALRVAVTLEAGEPLRRAQSEAAALRHTLEDSVDRTIGLKLVPRREPCDVYA